MKYFAISILFLFQFQVIADSLPSQTDSGNLFGNNAPPPTPSQPESSGFSAAGYLDDPNLDHSLTGKDSPWNQLTKQQQQLVLDEVEARHPTQPYQAPPPAPAWTMQCQPGEGLIYPKGGGEPACLQPIGHNFEGACHQGYAAVRHYGSEGQDSCIKIDQYEPTAGAKSMFKEFEDYAKKGKEEVSSLAERNVSETEAAAAIAACEGKKGDKQKYAECLSLKCEEKKSCTDKVDELLAKESPEADPEEDAKYTFKDNGEDVDIEQCLQLEKSAERWCAEQNSMYNMIAQQMVAAFKQPDGIAEGCKLQKQLSNFGTAAEVGMAAKCSSRYKQCKQVCGQAAERLKTMVESLEDEYDLAETNDAPPIQLRKIRKAKSQASAKYSSAKGKYGSCANMKDAVFSKGMNASMMQLQAYGAKKCVDEVKKAETGFEAPTNNDVFAGDCTSAANAANPICIKCNADPSAAGCEGITTRNSNETAETDPFGDDADSFGGEGYTDAAFDMGGGDVELDTPAGIAANGKGSRTIASGGGGGPGGGAAGAGGGGLESPQKPGDPNKKLNTDLVGGEKGGSGYSVSTGGGSGGYSDIGSASKSTFFEDFKDDGFNLKDFLPGRGKKGKKDSLSGLQKLRRPAMVGKSTQNIFDMIHNRYKIICLQGRLMGCKQKIPWKKPAWAID